MKEAPTQSVNQAPSSEKPGLLKRLFDKVDAAMKAKADEKAESGCCCSSESKDKSGKCC